MKTIKQISDELGVPKQTIEKRIARNADIQAHITKNDKGIKIVNADGERLIKAAYEATDTPIDKGIDTGTDGVNAAIAALTKQLEVKDTQIAALNEALLNAQREAHAAQILHAADKPKLLPDNTPEEKPGFFRRLFGKN